MKNALTMTTEELLAWVEVHPAAMLTRQGNGWLCEMNMPAPAPFKTELGAYTCCIWGTHETIIGAIRRFLQNYEATLFWLEEVRP